MAELLQVKPPRIYEMVAHRRLRVVRVGRLLRFRPDDVERFIERGTSSDG